MNVLAAVVHVGVVDIASIMTMIRLLTLVLMGGDVSAGITLTMQTVDIAVAVTCVAVRTVRTSH